jgi:AhpD family alkylhydroperoxidase
MTHIPLLDPTAATGRARAIMDGIAARRGRVPHMIRALGHSPAALAGYSGFHAALGGGVLSAGLRERIAIAVAAANDCRTCLAAHTHFGRGEGVSEQELAAAREGRSADPATEAALRFALAAMRGVGHVPPETVQAARAAGFGDAALMEIVATVFVNVFTNAVNHLAGTEPDDWSAQQDAAR